MAQAVRFRCLTQKARVRLEISPPGNCSGRGGTETGFSSSSLVPFLAWLRRMTEKLSL